MITELQKENLYRHYHGKVYGYILSKVHSVQTAEDLTEDVFVKIYENIERFDASKASLSTWMYTITRNTLIDHYRTVRIFDEIPETLNDGSSVEDRLCDEEMLETLSRALQTLDERERDIVILRFYVGKTLKEISAKMGISYTYVKVLQNRAFEKLKKVLS